MTRKEILSVAKPIIFSGDMINSMLAGRKSQTRRVIKPQPIFRPYENDSFGAPWWEWRDYWWLDGVNGFPESAIKDYARYKVGDYLYVKETYCRDYAGYYQYKADLDDGALEAGLMDGFFTSRMKSPRYMPKQASRIFLRVTDVRAERLQDICFNGIVAEGYPFNAMDGITAKNWFIDLWDSINGKEKGCAWEDSPWVWVYEFERVVPE